MVFRVLFLFDDEVACGPFRFNMFPLTDRGGENMTQADVQGFCEGLEAFDIEKPDRLYRERVVSKQVY